MNQKEIHQKASEIIAQVIDLPYEQALLKIDTACAKDQSLKQEVLALYNEIYEEETGNKEPVSDKAPHHTTKRIGKKDSVLRSKIISDWTKVIFGNKRNRLIVIVSFLIILLGAGFLSANYIRESILESEKEEKIALLNTNREILDRWIFYEKAKIKAAASNPDLIRYASLIDSLEQINSDKNHLRNSDVALNVTEWLKNAAQWGNYGFATFLSIKSPVVLFSSTLIDSTGITQMFNNALGSYVYEDYIKAQKGEVVFVPPVYDFEVLMDAERSFNPDVYCSFICPIKTNDGKMLGILSGGYLAKDQFSHLLQISKHGKTSETYAFDKEGRMISASRFTDELRKTYLLNYDSTAETLYNIALKDPRGNVLKGYKADLSAAEQDFTSIVELASNHLESKDSIYEGAIMEPYHDYRGIDVIGAYLWLPEYNFGLITEEDYDEALSALIYFRYTFIVFYLAILGLSFLLYNSNVRIARIGKKVDDFQLLGQYKLREKLGEGGFGEVHKAEHTFLKTPVAIKILKSEFANTDMLDRFEKEVKITSSLSHPNTIKVYDYGTTEHNNFYYVMEYLNGISLDKIVESEEEISVARGIYILYHICLSLKEAHEQGLVHRDIKPMNVMLCNQGGAYDVVKVLDFGLVKDLDTSVSQQTQINRIGGTPMFMAPERLRDPFNADQRVDIYAVGALGLYLFSGQYLLELVSQKMLSGQETLQADFRNHLIERKDIPQDLSDMLAQCIHFDPTKRPESIDILIDFLESKYEKNPWTRKDAMAWWKNYDVYS